MEILTIRLIGNDIVAICMNKYDEIKLFRVNRNNKLEIKAIESTIYKGNLYFTLDEQKIQLLMSELHFSRSIIDSFEFISIHSQPITVSMFTFFCGSTPYIKHTLFVKKNNNVYVADFNAKIFNLYSIVENIFHKYVGKQKIPCFILDNNSNHCVFYLHGGPEYHVDNSFNPVINLLIESNIDVICINYVGSTGYSNEYQERLINNGGILDVESVDDVITHYASKYSSFIIYGDSYGAYISLFFSQKKYSNIKGIVATGTFYDAHYTLLFSNSRQVIQKYVDMSANKRLKNDIINHSNCQIVLIHGENDLNCPIFPLVYLTGKNPMVKLIKMNNYMHYEVLPSKIACKSNLTAKTILDCFSD
ncbi:prolyl oligopeptidase family serine peptidase [Vagococcus sp. PNs007]|uniref:Prolyl oligopeptidase family serine peptidase n=1 Tax=Vagococcus proximus TaxID=2991417 RepID=A0ABT5X0M2_9ENTE|nr:prolyl oligopeptidase family serine peptidase [Vagococcus proximus]MDF0479553.1 prolyl oligopeptidase family serine peptidase [Vagococcus proximus]